MAQTTTDPIQPSLGAAELNLPSAPPEVKTAPPAIDIEAARLARPVPIPTSFRTLEARVEWMQQHFAELSPAGQQAAAVILDGIAGTQTWLMQTDDDGVVVPTGQGQFPTVEQLREQIAAAMQAGLLSSDDYLQVSPQDLATIEALIAVQSSYPVRNEDTGDIRTVPTVRQGASGPEGFTPEFTTELLSAVAKPVPNDPYRKIQALSFNRESVATINGDPPSSAGILYDVAFQNLAGGNQGNLNGEAALTSDQLERMLQAVRTGEFPYQGVDAEGNTVERVVPMTQMSEEQLAAVELLFRNYPVQEGGAVGPVNEALRSTLLAELRTANSGFPSYDELQDEYKQAMTEYQAASARYKLGLVVSEFDTEGWTMSVGKDSNGAYFRVEAPDIGDWRFAIQGQQGEGGENMTVTGIAQADLYRISNELSVIAVMNFGDIGRTYQNNQLRTHSGGVLDTRLEADDLLGASGGLGIQWTGQIPLGAGAVVSPYATVMAGEAGVGVSRTGGGFAVNGPSGQAGVGVTFPINNFMAATGRLYMSVDSTPGVGGNALGGGGAFALTGRF